MSIIQLLFTGSGIYTKNNYYTTTQVKPRITVMADSPIGPDSLLTLDTVKTRSILVEMWGGGGASGSTRYGNSGYGGSGGYISGRIPISALGTNILRLSVGGGGGSTGGGILNAAGSPDYYAKPLDQFLEFNTSTIQHVASTSTSSNPTFSTVVPISGSTVSSVSDVTYSTISQVTSATSSSSVTYSTITPVAGSSVSSVSNVTYSTVTQVPGASVSSISSPTYNTVTHVASVSDTGVNSLTITPGILQVGDIILVASVCATGTTPQNNPNTPTTLTSGGLNYTVLENATVTGNVNYKLSYLRVTNTTLDADILNLSAITTDSGGGGGGGGGGPANFTVAHTASIFRNVIGVGDPITSLVTSTATSTSIDPPSIVTETPNYMSVAFGFHNDRSITPTGIPGGYTQTVVQAVGTNANANNEATIMVAHRSLSTSAPADAPENPGAFTVPDLENYVAITVGLMPTKTLSTISGSMTLSGLQAGDVVLVSSVSDGGNLNPPNVQQSSASFTNISNATGAASLPSYRVSWKRVVAGDLSAGSLTISNLSLSGTISGGQANNQPAGVAHYATAFRNVSTTTDPIFTASTGTPTGNPDSPVIPATGTLSTANHAILSFGFLNNRSLSTVAAPGGYTLLTNGVNTVGSDATGTTEATSMVASINLTTQVTENPGAFAVTGSGPGANYAAVTVALAPTRTLSTISGSMTIPAAAGLQAGDVVLVSSVSDEGTMSTPSALSGSFGVLSSNAGGSPAYGVFWKRLVTGPTSDFNSDGSVTIGGLSLSGGILGGLATGVAHYAVAFRGASTTINPLITTPAASTGTGNPNSPIIPSVGSFPTVNYTSISFGFLNNTGFPTVAPPAGYTQLSSLEVSDNTPGTEATSMVAYSNLTTTAAENPGAFGVTNIGGQNYAAVTVALAPTRTSSPITGSMTLSGLQEGDVVLVSSVSDGGAMSRPSALLSSGLFEIISNVTGSSTSPAYGVFWKRIVAGDLSAGSLTITGLSLSGTVFGGDADGDPAGVAHYAVAFRGVSTTTNPLFPAASTGTGNPNSPSINVTTSNHTVLSFGFLNDNGYTTVAPPTTPSPYTQLSTLRVSDNTPGTEATSMVAYRNLNTELTADPGPFSVTGINANQNYAAVTVALAPTRTLSTISGSMTIPAGVVQAGDVVLVSSVSDGGTMNIPNALGGTFTGISTSGAGASPAYRVSWKRIVAGDLSAGSLSISNLSLSGTTTGGLAAGVAHHATAFRGVDPNTAISPILTNATPASTGTGNPDPPTISPLSVANYTSVVFGFLNNNALPTVAPPTTPANYIQLSTLTVSDNTPGTEATSMVAYRTSLGSGQAGENPGPFSVTGVGGENYTAVTVGLRPSPVAAAGDFSVLNLPPVQANDIIIVASVSDGGALSTPTGYTEVVTSQTGSNSPSYQISYKITNGTDTQVTNLSPGGSIDGGDNDGSPTAGVAHIASVYRGVSLTTPPAGFVAPNNNGNPDPPQINGVSSGDGVVVFGFLDDISITDANITAPTTPIPGYTKTITRAVGTDNNGANEATIMSAFRELTASGNENPGAFSVNGNDGRRNSAISIRLVPQVNARFSTVTGGCGGSSGGYSGIFLLDGTPLLIAGGGGGGGGGTTYPFIAARGGNGGSGSGFPGTNGNISVLDTALLPLIVYRKFGSGGGGGTAVAGGSGGITLSGGTGTPISGNPGESGVIWSSPEVSGFLTGGRGANSPYTDLTSLPLYGANATGGWNRGAGGGSSRIDSFTTPVPAPTDCGGGGGAGYYGGGGGGSGDGGGGGGGGGGSNYADPLVSVLVSAGGDSLTPGIPAATLSANYIAGVAVGGAPVFSNGVDVLGNRGGNGLIVLTYFA
jgi:hypothetical protein